MKMMPLLFATLTMVGMGGLMAQEPEAPFAYFGQKTPDTIPELFAPGLVSRKDRHEFGSVFTADGREFYFGVDTGEQSEIHMVRWEGGVWGEPQKLFADSPFSHNDPMLSPDGSRLYYISDRPGTETRHKKDYDIWFSLREGGGWSPPINAGYPVNSPANEYYASFAADGSLFFASNHGAGTEALYNYDIYRSPWKDGSFRTPVQLPAAINTPHYEADVFVSPDESYMIFCAVRREGSGQGDLYISFRGGDGLWLPAVNLGETINTPGHELCPFVTADGNYFFFTRDGDIYWADSQIFKGLRKD
ncbi:MULTISPECIES: PD40 domain-containing protein [Robiginitalea]|nr:MULTISPECIES: PD40 domain-containing protein [Robiginitalea]MDC6355147.1 PD40 domain-containing protein [Robiginitalea sp. PM2]MDC6375638.1 PD40 domain-containing protein [Robiginitalea sp. SP8]